MQGVAEGGALNFSFWPFGFDEMVFSVYLVLVALFLGSFINLAVDRLPRGESVVSPRSHCRSCGRVLNAVDLLPVLGYVIRRGRCASCGVEIGVRSPLIEAAAGAMMGLSIVAYGLNPGWLVGLVLISAMGIVLVAAGYRTAAATGR